MTQVALQLVCGHIISTGETGPIGNDHGASLLESQVQRMAESNTDSIFFFVDAVREVSEDS